MIRKHRLIVSAVVLLTAGALQSEQINWRPVDGDWNGNFGDARHWVGDKVPGAGDTAYFPPDSSPSAFTVTVDQEHSVGSVYVGHFGSPERTVTFSGSGKISSASGSVNYFGANNLVVFNGVSFYAAHQCGCYGRVELTGGAVFTSRNSFYFFQNNDHVGKTSVIVNDGTCELYRII